MSGETELKPCPNPDCDKSKGLLSRNTVIRGGRIPDHVVSCLTCGMSGPACSGPYQAMEGWNGLPRANPPGYELVPEGTMDALRRATISLGELAGITQLNQYDYAALEACRKVLKSVAAKKDTPNAQG